MTGRDTGDHDRVLLFSFVPGAIAVIAVVVADLAAEVPGLPGVLVDERIVEINPMIADGSISFYLDIRSMAREFENVSDERGLVSCVSTIQLIGLMEDRVFLREPARVDLISSTQSRKMAKAANAIQMPVRFVVTDEGWFS